MVQSIKARKVVEEEARMTEENELERRMSLEHFQITKLNSLHQQIKCGIKHTKTLGKLLRQIIHQNGLLFVGIKSRQGWRRSSGGFFCICLRCAAVRCLEHLFAKEQYIWEIHWHLYQLQMLILKDGIIFENIHPFLWLRYSLVDRHPHESFNNYKYIISIWVIYYISVFFFILIYKRDNEYVYN